MRLGKLAAVVATMAATAATGLAGAAPAQAQTQDPICFSFYDTPLEGNKLDGRCLWHHGPNGEMCLPVGGFCVSGVNENIEAVRQMIEDRVPGIDDLLPVCTPDLLAGPICVTH